MKHNTEQHMQPCNCRTVDECTHNTFSEVKALECCLKDFNNEMKSKLLKKRNEGKCGWDSPEWDIENIKSQLIKHIEKGDFIDVANFAMFAWNKNA